MMAIDNTGAAYEHMKTWLLTENPETVSFMRDRFFTEPSVYDWHKPNCHPAGYFRVRRDPYEWFDPITGEPEASDFGDADTWADMADVSAYSVAAWKRLYLNEWSETPAGKDALMTLKIEKAPGWEWEIDYEDEDDDGLPVVETMSVFGCIKIEDAIQEARRSLAGVALEPDAAAPTSAIVAARRSR